MGYTKRISALLFSVAAMCCMLIGCEETPGMQRGNVRINLFSANTRNARNIDPQGSAPLQIASYTVTGSGPAGQQLTETVTTSNLIELHELMVGNWTFHATSYNDQGNALASGTASTHISSGDNQVELALDQLVGSGTLSATFHWDADQTCADSVLSMRIIDADGQEITGAQTSCDFSIGLATITKDLPAGYYTLIVSLSTDTNLVSGCIETLRVIDNTISSADRTLVIGKTVDGVVLSIINEIVSPIEGTITCSPSEPVLGEPTTLTFTPVLPSGVTTDDLLVQWYCEGVSIDGASSLSYTIPHVKAGTYRYDIVISIPAQGSVGSAALLISIPPQPAVI